MDKPNASVWDEVTEGWPDPIYLKNLDELPGFPYSNGYFRNLVTGKKRDKDLSSAIIRVGKFPALRKNTLRNWLNRRTAL